MTRWLSEEQQRSWRAWVAASHLLDDRLSRELQAEHSLTIKDYEILVVLSETPGRRMRMSELAERTLSSRSRLSHQVDRLADRGLVAREQCTDDRRGAFALLTEGGWAALVAAAPDHVRGVRTHLVDVLTPEEFALLGRACERIVAHLDQSGPACGQQGGGRVDL